MPDSDRAVAGIDLSSSQITIKFRQPVSDGSATLIDASQGKSSTLTWHTPASSCVFASVEPTDPERTSFVVIGEHEDGTRFCMTATIVELPL